MAMADPRFQRLKEEKRTRIIQGAIEEFARHGYESGSANRIVQRAGISKGSLFTYFASKDDLYIYSADYVLKQIIPLIEKRLAEMPADILRRLSLLAESIIDIYIKNPLYYKFFMGILDSSAFHLRQQLLKRNAELFNYIDLFRGIDDSRFRMDLESTLLLIKWLFTGIKQELFSIQEVKSDPGKLRLEFLNRLKRVISLLEKGIY